MSDHQENDPASRLTEEECEDPDNDFEMACSYEEIRLIDGVEWEPSPEEIIEVFEKIDKEESLALEWTTLGRRPPTPVGPVAKFNEQNEEDNAKENIPEEKSDFDFQDEMSSPEGKAIRPLRFEHGPRGSARKKTVTLDDILSNMARHRKLDMMDDDEDPLP